MCRSWLKYVAPLLAEATRADGRFSLTLDRAAVPLAAPAASDVEGVMAIHHARVGPGPLSERFLWIAQQIKAVIERRPLAPVLNVSSNQWLSLPAQNVAFEMRDGRVYHQNLELTAGDVGIRTQGSVGLDQSLQLVAEVPIRDEWVESDQLLSSLKGQVVRIPIRGELSRPELDGRALQQFAAQMAGEAATRLLEQELSRGLQRLLQPRK
jgi:hypothetical protein